MATRISIPPLEENNLIRNNCFGQKLSFYRYTGSGSAEVMAGPPVFCRVSTGTLFHAFDIDNQEHANPDGVFPYNGTFVFKFRARGKGKLCAGVRWRISHFRGDMDLMERETPEYTLEEEFKEYRLEGIIDDPRVSVADRLFFKVTEGFADITAISLYYPEPKHDVTFDRPHIVALPGEEFTFKCSGAEKIICCYGHCENELAQEILPGSGKYKMLFRATGGEGMRFVGIGKEQNSRHSLFVSSPAPELTAQMRKYRFGSKPKHLLFFGDSLTAYDAGRNYTDIAGAFLPDNWTYMNAGIGGDDLLRLAKRLQGKPLTYRLEHFEHIWDKTPDEIFLLYGANDTKAPWRTDFKIPTTTPEEQKTLWEEIREVFHAKAPEARVTIISATPGFHPYQLERTGRLKVQEINHMLFGIPEHVKRFNRIAKKFAASNNWSYLDFHKVCSKHGDPQSLFVPDDGVHMSLSGHQLLASALLKHMSKKQIGASRK